MANTIDNMFLQKQFLMAIYKPIIGQGNNILNNEKIVICYKQSYQNGEGQDIISFPSKGYNNIDDLISAITNDKRTYNTDTYFNLTTSNSDNRKTENMQTRTAIGIDFDTFPEGETPIDYVQRKCKEVGLFYNILVNSGNGIHVYFLIEPTKDLEKVQQVTNRIIELTGADKKANTSTQLLRIPCTFNCKNGRKPVVPIHIEPLETVKRKKIDDLYNIVFSKGIESKGGKTLKITNNCQKVWDLINTGSQTGNRNNDLMFIYSKLRQCNIPDGQINNAIELWNSHNPMEDFEYIYNYIKTNFKPNVACPMDCEYKNNCFSHVFSDFEYSEEEVLINSNEKILSKCNKKKGRAKQMNGNMLVVYGLLNLHKEGLNIEELMDLMTAKKKKKVVNVAMSERTLRTTLKEMEAKNYINSETRNRKKYYHLAPIKLKEELNLVLPYGMYIDVINGVLTVEELHFYCFLRYLQNEQKRLTPSIKGNQFIMTQYEIAEKYGLHRENINNLIEELEGKKYLQKEYRRSSNNQYDYCVYYLAK